ncbi:MAG: hypothetical protein ACQCN6_08690 [Candidatus Bathyarchaeia archaeon]
MNYENSKTYNFIIFDSETFVLYPDDFEHRIRSAYKTAKSRVIIVRNNEIMEKYEPMDLEIIRRARKRGVKMHFLTNNINEGKIDASEGLLFEIKFASTKIPCTFILFDKSELFFGLYDSENFGYMPYLWTKNSGIIALAESYFEQMWAKSFGRIRTST